MVEVLNLNSTLEEGVSFVDRFYGRKFSNKISGGSIVSRMYDCSYSRFTSFESKEYGGNLEREIAIIGRLINYDLACPFLHCITYPNGT